MAITTGTTPSNPCIKLQEALMKYYGKDPAATMYSTGTLDALASAQNRSGQMELVTGDGARPTTTSNRKVQMRYVPKTCETSGVTWSECSYGTPEAPLWKTADITINREATFGFDLTESEYRDMCETLEDGRLAFFNAKFADATSRLNALAIIDVVGAMGTYPISGNNSVTTPITVPVSTPAGAFNPAGYGLIQTVYNQMNVMESPIIVGAGKLDYARNAAFYSGLTNLGLDGSKGTIPYFRDPFINSGFFNDGDDHILSWRPGSIILAEWLDYVGIYEKETTIKINGVEQAEKVLTTTVMPDGSTWSTLYVLDCSVHKFRFKRNIGIAQIPSDAFGSECQPYSWAVHFLAGCADLTCNDINSLVGPGAQSS